MVPKQHSPDVEMVRMVQGLPRKAREATGRFQPLPRRHRTCCLDSLCSATSAHNLALSGRNMETFACGWETRACNILLWPTYLSCLPAFFILGLWNGPFLFCAMHWGWYLRARSAQASKQLHDWGCVLHALLYRRAPVMWYLELHKGKLRDLAHIKAQSSAAMTPCTFQCDCRNITSAFNFQHYESPALVVYYLFAS